MQNDWITIQPKLHPIHLSWIAIHLMLNRNPTEIAPDTFELDRDPIEIAPDTFELDHDTFELERWHQFPTTNPTHIWMD
jgi:hypothetical protein